MKLVVEIPDDQVLRGVPREGFADYLAAAGVSAPEKTMDQVRMQAAQELISELRAAEMKWVEPPGEARGFGRNPKVIWEALVSERVENERLMQWVDDLQSGMFVNCVYCGHRYGRQDEVLASMADILKAHIAQCPKHPMSELLRVIEDGRAMVASANAHISHGGPTRADSIAWVAAADTAIAHVKGGGSAA
jgi:hypothetical protein